MENSLFNFFRTTKVCRIFISIISVLAMLVNLMGGNPPAVGEKDIAKNVILLIGDGMGENTLELAKQERGIELFMETMPIRGQSETRSASSPVTDSAAGATALACGIRTNNEFLGVYHYDKFAFKSIPQNVTEFAISKGMKTGIVTTDSNTGATPAGFSSHTYERSNSAYIASQQTTSNIDLIWSAASPETTSKMCISNGYTYVTSLTELDTLKSNQKSFAQFDEMPALNHLTQKAIEVLDNDKGFFLMVEGAHIDSHGHGNNVEGATEAVYEFDNAVKAAVKYAENDGNTIVIVTADHETGAIKFNGEKYVYTSRSHSGVNVPLFVYGSDRFVQNNTAIKNTDVAKYMAMAMGSSADEFPMELSVTDDMGLYLKAS